MELTLAPETQRMLEQKLKEGRSADEVVQAGILALTEQEFPDLDQETQHAIDIAEDQIERGEFVELHDVENELRAMFRK